MVPVLRKQRQKDQKHNAILSELGANLGYMRPVSINQSFNQSANQNSKSKQGQASPYHIQYSMDT